jgi:hypothetical protein
MVSITVNISDDRFQQLQQLAKDSQVSTEDLLRASIEDWLASPTKYEFTEASTYVLKKNAELYQRLA